MEKTLVYGGETPEHEIRPPLLSPNILRIAEGPIEALHSRVPIDDEHTRIEQIDRVERGEEPTVGVASDASENVSIAFESSANSVVPQAP